MAVRRALTADARGRRARMAETLNPNEPATPDSSGMVRPFSTATYSASAATASGVSSPHVSSTRAVRPSLSDSSAKVQVVRSVTLTDANSTSASWIASGIGGFLSGPLRRPRLWPAAASYAPPTPSRPPR